MVLLDRCSKTLRSLICPPILLSDMTWTLSLDHYSPSGSAFLCFCFVSPVDDEVLDYPLAEAD